MPAAGQVRVLIIYGLLLMLSSLVMTVDRTIWEELLVFARAARPGSSTLMFFAVAVPIALRESVLFAAWVAASFSAAAAAAFIFNDLADIDRDALSKPYRPFVRYDVDHYRARRAAWVLVGASAFLALSHGGSSDVRATQLLAIVGAITYTPFVAHWPQWKTVFAAALATMPIGAVLFVSPAAGLADSAFLIVVCAFLVGRETMMDVLDLQGDRETGLATVASRIGQSRALVLGVCVQLAAAMSASALLMQLGNRVAAWAVLGLFAFTLLYFFVGSDHQRRVAIRLQWLPMLAAVIAFAG